VPRAVVVVESMAALVLVDALMENMSSRLEHMIEFYNS
ncbi:MAG: chorismate synthase, partial [Lachnospiraceae bacterium]